jgi:3-dehydroquinate synthase
MSIPTLSPLFFSTSEDLLHHIKSLQIPRSVYICDNQTQEHCFAPFFSPAQQEVLVVHHGDEHKSFEYLEWICKQLLLQSCGKETVLMNLGGGMVTDLGGFAAAVYKRGLSYMNIPTTLIGMADAAYGGKTAINCAGVKNSVGVFHPPSQVLIWDGFLQTLPEDHLRSGWAEILKMLLLFDAKLFHECTDTLTNLNNPGRFLRKALELKERVVQQDPYEQHYRKMLNYGHSIGHAIESCSGYHMSHGQAICLGMQWENHISVKCGLMTAERCRYINGRLQLLFPEVKHQWELHSLMSALKNDKKNQRGALQMTLLRDVGMAEIAISVEESIVKEVCIQMGASGE